jgi:hypothetical protein
MRSSAAERLIEAERRLTGAAHGVRDHRRIMQRASASIDNQLSCKIGDRPTMGSSRAPLGGWLGRPP